MTVRDLREGGLLQTGPQAGLEYVHFEHGLPLWILWGAMIVPPKPFLAYAFTILGQPILGIEEDWPGTIIIACIFPASFDLHLRPLDNILLS